MKKETQNKKNPLTPNKAVLSVAVKTALIVGASITFFEAVRRFEAEKKEQQTHLGHA